MKKLMILICIAAMAFPLFAKEKIGSIADIYGEVSIVREGKSLTADFGVQIENQDLIKTGPDGFLEIETDPATGINSIIRVKESSNIVIELSALRQKQNATMHVLSGTVGFKVKSITQGGGFGVKTESAVMGVRGTEFEVAQSVQGDVLVSCEEGKVECEDAESGKKAFAEPGKIVEKSQGDTLKQVPVNLSSLKNFKEKWVAEKLSVFKANGGRAIANYGARYLRLSEMFNKAYNTMVSVKAGNSSSVFETWVLEDRKNRTGGNMQIMREKKAIIRALMDMRKSAFLLEPVYYRLLQMEEYKDSFSSYKLKNGMTVSRFYKKFNSEAADLTRKMAHFRYVLKLYAKRNGGNSPFDSFDSGMDNSFDSDMDNFDF